MRLKSSKQRCHFYFHFWIPIVEAGVTHVDMKICALCLCPEVQKLSSLVLPSEVIIAQSSVPGKLTCKPLWVCWSLFKDQPQITGAVFFLRPLFTVFCGPRRRSGHFLQNLDQSGDRDGSVHRTPGVTWTHRPVQEQQPDVGGEATFTFRLLCPSSHVLVSFFFLGFFF